MCYRVECYELPDVLLSSALDNCWSSSFSVCLWRKAHSQSILGLKITKDNVQYFIPRSVYLSLLYTCICKAWFPGRGMLGLGKATTVFPWIPNVSRTQKKKCPSEVFKGFYLLQTFVKTKEKVAFIKTYVVLLKYMFLIVFNNVISYGCLCPNEMKQKTFQNQIKLIIKYAIFMK